MSKKTGDNLENVIDFNNFKRQRVFVIFRHEGAHQILDVTRKTREEIIDMLPTPTPNFIRQPGLDKSEVLQNVIDQHLDVLL